jgi:diguanylate cyclase (GGDEF)-like protein
MVPLFNIETRSHENPCNRFFGDGFLSAMLLCYLLQLFLTCCLALPAHAENLASQAVNRQSREQPQFQFAGYKTIDENGLYSDVSPVDMASGPQITHVLPSGGRYSARGPEILLDRLQDDPKVVSWIISIAMLAIGISGMAFLWNMQMRRLVRERTEKLQAEIAQREAAELEIKQLAFYDPLTGLPNRLLLQDRLEQIMTLNMRSKQTAALLLLDLDNFKGPNDTFGRNIGDLLLKEVASRIGNCMRKHDTIARLGGDEFIIILDKLSANLTEAATQAETISEKILSIFAQPFQLADYSYRTTASIGVTLFKDNWDSLDELLKRADLAMYQAKDAGRNSIRFFDPHMQAVVSARVTLETNLRLGLQRKEFVLNYQPQMDVNGNIIGTEALIRWRHPQLGVIAPAEFIPLAEETGLILPLGQWVLETACLQLVAWAAQPHTASLTIAVNVSARQFRQPDFVDLVLTTLATTGARAHNLKLELTESLLLDDVEDVISKMTRLKARGVCFSLDDFGTGYSSLAYLKRLPLDQLKIDQSFVRDILTDANDAIIVRTIIALGNNLNLSVIAEGVETRAQQKFLADHGCHTYQGYLFSKPLPITKFEALLVRSTLAPKSRKLSRVSA